MSEYLFKMVCLCIEDKVTSNFEIGVEEASISGKIPLCTGHTPEDAPPRHSVILDRTGGVVDGMLPDKVDLPIQIISRSEEESYMTAYDDAWELYRALHGSCCKPLPLVVSGHDYDANIIDAMQSPAYIGLDEKRRHQFSCNYLFRISIAHS